MALDRLLTCGAGSCGAEPHPVFPARERVRVTAWERVRVTAWERVWAETPTSPGQDRTRKHPQKHCVPGYSV
jgi:hypothetical protein